MTRAEAISFAEDRIGLFGGQMEEFLKLSVEALKKQRKGYWIILDSKKICCSCCQRDAEIISDFCPNCGADLSEKPRWNHDRFKSNSL